MRSGVDINRRKKISLEQKKELSGFLNNKIIRVNGELSLFIGMGSTAEYFFEIFVGEFYKKFCSSDGCHNSLIVLSNNLSILKHFRNVCKDKNKKFLSPRGLSLLFYGQEVDPKNNSLKPLPGYPALESHLNYAKTNIAIISCANIWHDKDEKTFYISAFSPDHANVLKSICNKGNIPRIYLIADDLKFDITTQEKHDLENLKVASKNLIFLIVPESYNQSNLSIIIELEGESRVYDGNEIYSRMEAKYNELLNELEKELEQLLEKLAQKGESSKRDKAIDAVSEAKNAVTNKNYEEIKIKLAVIRGWTLSVAKEIGAKLLIKYIEVKLGL